MQDEKKERGGRGEGEKMQDETKTKHNGGEERRMGRRMIVVV